MSPMTPREIVQELDKHIVGQTTAKRAVAIALRNRWRRMQVEEPLRAEITPKNILMIGPTGVGKTEIARRLAKLANAPFIKVEATKFTEVGYVGRDVDSIVRDLVDIAVKMTREQEVGKVRARAPRMRPRSACSMRCCRGRAVGFAATSGREARRDTRQRFRKMLREGAARRARDRDRSARAAGRRRDHGAAGMEEMTQQLQGMFQNLGQAPQAPPQAARSSDALQAARRKRKRRSSINEEE